MAPGLVSIVADLGAHYPGQVIEVVSGYRAPPYGAPHSKHFSGHAMDLRVRGARTAKVRDYLWTHHHHVGVGHYVRQNFIHVDYRPRDPDIAWTSRHAGAPYHYHPRWARRARRNQPRPSRVGL
jgi:uncharacterized protein YcbK (DUF882 family)